MIHAAGFPLKLTYIALHCRGPGRLIDLLNDWLTDCGDLMILHTVLVILETGTGFWKTFR